MIDSMSETLLPLAQAANELPRRRRGKKTHVSTLYRWALAGCRGVVLETIQVGATRCTSQEALQRFFERLSLDRRDESITRSATRSLCQRQRQSDKAGEILEEMGA
jgi:hypothetical protein